ncbi:SDR family oxidoreductase [Micromonospora sp. ATA51]|uniref:SDR family oxidoreductase n=1 Tax=Micromonospora sp. ATA51 TaxID=2806098 RepID=UPI002814F08C|nr:SDR family oxidoreductase [Micromonospora sp. ATA51]
MAVGRDTDRLADLGGRGVVTQLADYDDAESLQAAFAGADQLMFVSGSEVGRRVVQHGNVVTAAKQAGVKQVVYTSIAKADTSRLVLAAEHKATEQLIKDAGLPYVFLRNSWYLENYTPQLPAYLQHGVAGAADDGRVSAATRADYAEAAAVVLTTEGHTNRVYELGGTPFTMTALAAEISRQTGTTVSYLDLPVDKYTELLVAAGVPEGYAALLADGDRGLAQGDLEVGDDLAKLLGRTPTTLAEAIRAAL